MWINFRAKILFKGPPTSKLWIIVETYRIKSMKSVMNCWIIVMPVSVSDCYHDSLGVSLAEERLRKFGQEGGYLTRQSDVKAGFFILSVIETSFTSNRVKLRLRFTWRSPDVHLTTWPSSDLPLTLTRSLPYLDEESLNFTWNSPDVHLAFPDIHLTFTWPPDHHLTFPWPLQDPYLT